MIRSGDVVLKLTLRSLDEVESFQAFLARFLDAACDAVDRVVAPAEPPFLMVSSEPWEDADLRTVTFLEPHLAAAFAQGWERACGAGRALSLI